MASALTMRPATRQKTKIRIGISGPSGSGKTYSALLLASGIADWSKIALIDTENGSGDLYAHLGPYNVVTLAAPFSPERYIEAIKACETAGMEVIVIDSATHEWDGKGGCLESNDLLGQTKFKGNTWAAWSVTTPRHQKFIEAITTSPCHIITTARAKTDTIQTEDKKIKKVGMKEIQREGFEYELTINFTLDRDGHYATASKDRTSIFISQDPFKITPETGKQILEWTMQGIEKPIEAPQPARQAERPKTAPVEKPAAPKPPIMPREEGDVMISKEQSTQAFRLWNELMEHQQVPIERRTGLLVETLLQKYGVKTFAYLRSKQAQNMIDGLTKSLPQPATDSYSDAEREGMKAA